uniref:BPTI/Kunitz inhibitor domain-containing protein n=1 Tax=Romanomermis culicivorax TaxID=13658 RepID=A0A915ITQ5_ROMCU
MGRYGGNGYNGTGRGRDDNTIMAFWPSDLEVVTPEDKIVNHTTICLQPAVVGECRALHRRWHFNKATGFCEQFHYGGCGGNDNNFKQLAECQRVCEDNQPCNKMPEKVPGHYKKTTRQNDRGCPVYKVTTDTKRTFIVYEGAILTFNCNVVTREEKSVHEIIALLPAQPSQRQLDTKFAQRFATIEGIKKKPINVKMVNKQTRIACNRTRRSFLSCAAIWRHRKHASILKDQQVQLEKIVSRIPGGVATLAWRNDERFIVVFCSAVHHAAYGFVDIELQIRFCKIDTCKCKYSGEHPVECQLKYVGNAHMSDYANKWSFAVALTDFLPP